MVWDLLSMPKDKRKAYLDWWQQQASREQNKRRVKQNE